MQNKLIFAIILLLIIFSSCRKERLLSKVDQDKIYCTYLLEYEPSSNKSTYLAEFRYKNAKGDCIRLDAGSFIEVNGVELEYDESRYRYSHSFEGLVDSAVFEWTALDGEIFRNQVSMADSIDYPIGFDSIILVSPSFEFTWQGAPISQADEMVVLYINGGENNEQGNFSRRFRESYTLMQDSLQANSLFCLDCNYEYYYDLFREIRPELQEGTNAGGSIKSTYKIAKRGI